MNSNLKRPSTSAIGTEYDIQRKRLKHSTVDLIKKLINSSKGEVVQALHMVFSNDSFNFEINHCPNLTNKFSCYLNIEGYSFIGYGNNKGSAKSSASKIALSYLIEELKCNVDTKAENVVIVDPYSSVREKLHFPDIIANLVLQKYNELKSNHKHDLPWYKMIAGIVMVREDEYCNGKVIALSTGSKCVDKQYIRNDGTTIVDSHAEILSRRAFVRFLYNNLEKTTNQDSIFEVSDNHNRFKLRDNVSFYLFINSAPCGDCRIFAVSGGDAGDRHPNRMSRGLLRIKLDGGNSTVPINNQSKYELEGRLMVMSCSDKLLKMNVLGVQGSLLNYFIEPVYLTGIIISDLFQESHVMRALHGRIENADFQSPFTLRKINLYGTSTEFKIASKSPKTSINWITDESVEILNSVGGQTVTKGMSRLSKRSLFEKFLQMYYKRKPSNDGINNSYEWFKANSRSYQNAKNTFKAVLRNRNLGQWVKRQSLDDFRIMK